MFSLSVILTSITTPFSKHNLRFRPLKFFLVFHLPTHELNWIIADSESFLSSSTIINRMSFRYVAIKLFEDECYGDGDDKRMLEIKEVAIESNFSR